MSKHVSISPEEAADRLAIRELVEAYALCADRRDAKGQMALYDRLVPQGGRITLGTARACSRRRFRSNKAVRAPHALLNRPSFNKQRIRPQGKFL